MLLQQNLHSHETREYPLTLSSKLRGNAALVGTCGLFGSRCLFVPSADQGLMPETVETFASTEAVAEMHAGASQL